MKLPRILALIACCLPLLLRAQNTVFNDSFTSDLLNPGSYPAVTATATGWDVLTNKNAPVPTESGGVLTINMAATTSGFAETQALFAPAPVQLLPGTYVELTATFVPTFIVTNASDNFIVGLFNSGGVAPLSGLLNSGLSSGLTTFASGGAKGWIGYNGNIPLTGASPKMLNRVAQTAANNTTQDVVVDSQSTSVGYSVPAGTSASSVGAMSTTLTNGSTYTLDYKLSLSADGLTLTTAVSLYNGTGTTGTGVNTLIGSYTGKFTGTALVTKAFDALAFGWRADSGSASNIKLSALTVTTTGGAPWFTTQPPASLAASLGSSITLTTVVGGTVSSYQWQVSTNGGSSYSNIDTTANPSAATAAFTLASVQNSDAGLYRVVATNAAGSTTSTTSALTVTSTAVAPTIVTNPASATVLGGTAQTFSVAANGTAPLTYQWQKSPDGVTFTPIVGATAASYAIASASLTDEGYYNVVVTNVAGSATSTTAQLTVNQPLTITGQPVGAALNFGATYTLSATAVGKPAPTYQWYLNGVALSGATNSIYVIASAAASNAGIYTVVASNTAGDSVTSSGAAVAVLSSSLATTVLTPTATPTGVAPDARLTLTFNQPISVGIMGTIKIYDASNATIPVDTIDLIAGTALMKTLRAASTLSTQALPVQNKTVGTLTNFNYYPITVSGNTATIYPRNNVLTYGKSYFVTIDPGVFTDSTGLSYAGISSSSGWAFSTKTASPSTSATQFVVAADGSGDFYTVQAALDYIPSGNTTPRTLFIRKGTYFEQVYFTGKHAITFLGEDRAQSVIVYPNNNNFNNVSGSYHRMTLQADHVNNVVFANLSVTNSTPKGGSQAEALILNGTTTAQGIISNVTLFSFQDTLQINGQAYITDSHISGDVDFMWGGGPCFFNNCEITQLSSGAYFTQIRNGTSTHGFVYSNCRFDASASVTGSFLGRIDPTAGSFPNSEMVVVDSKFGDATNNAFLNTTTGVSGANYLAGWWLLNNAASGAVASGVHDWTNSIVNAGGTAISNPNTDTFTTMPTDAATQANYRNVPWVLGTNLAGTSTFSTWTPAFAPLIAVSPTAQTVNAGSSFTLSVQAFGIPTLTYQWLLNGAPIAGATGATYTVASSGSADAGTYSVVVGNGSSSVTTTAVALVVHGAPPVIVLQPANTSGLLGTTATLNAWAQGDTPFTYQWLKNGTPITGATSQSLRLTGLQASDAGSYAVAISNAGGTTTSANATLTIVAPATAVPTLPQIPVATFDVTAYGAVGDGATDNTAAIQAAINAAKAAGGGTIELPPASGAYLSGPITLGSHLDLQVDAGATLRALPFGVYPNSHSSPSHFITIPSSSTDVEFSGGGTIDGDGAAWWAAFNANSNQGRPRLVQITKTTNMLYTGVTFLNSPNFHLAFSGANNNVTLFGVTISAPGTSPNTDGMDVAGTNFLVQNCSVADGDDNIVAKPGSVFCRNIYIANCAIGTGHGVSIGGQTNVGLDGMVVTNCTFNGTSSALRFKADPTEGGPVQNVTFSNLTMTNVQFPILFYSYYDLLGSPGATSGSSQITPAKVNADNATPPDSLASTTIPTWKNITVTNLTVINGSGYSTIWGLPTASGLIANVTLNNVTIQGGAGLELYDATNIQLTGTTSVGPIITDNALAITGQPTGKTINAGDGVTFSATAVGGSGTNNTGLTYQWNLNGAPLTNGVQADGSTITGSTTATLAIANARVTGAGNYTVTVSTTLDGYNTTTNALVANSLPVSATSSAATLTVNPLPATITLSDATFTYDGTPKALAVATSPAGVAVQLAYNGSPTAPTNAGVYAVVATLADPNYAGASATASLTIQPAAATVALSNLAFTYDGTAKSAPSTTSPVGLTVMLTYNGSATAPSTAGSYAVSATVADPNYTGNTTGTLVIAQAVPVLNWSAPSAITYGTPLSLAQLAAMASTAGTFAYTPGVGAILMAGANQALLVGFIPADPTDFTTATTATTITVLKASATVTLGGLAATYDGTPKAVTATTSPAGLAVSFTYDGSSTAPTNAGSYPVVATINDANYVGSATDTLVVSQATPVLTWSAPAAITYGTPLDATQLNATASTAGTSAYTPAAGTVLNAGMNQTLSVAFTPTDTANFTAGAATTTITVNQAPATVTLGNLTATYDGTPKAATATTSPAGLSVTLTYNGDATAPTNAGSYAVVATINDANYVGSATGTLVVSQAVPVLTWSVPAAITYGAALDVTQLKATASTAGTFAYTPAAGTVLNAGANQTLGVSFTPTDAVNFTAGTATTLITVNQALATVTLGSLAATYDGTAKAVTATTSPAGLAVTFTYNNSATVPTAAGSYPVVAIVNSGNYTGSATGTLVISKATPVLTWTAPAAIVYGTALGATQFNATASTAGTFAYTPAAGTILNAGANQALSATFAPTDAANYTAASAATTITVNQAPATVTLGALAATYDGTAKSATATTTPAGLNVGLTYNGGATPPTNAGSYTVVATVNDANYTGSATGTLVIGKATPVLTWSTPAAITYGTALGATQLKATASVAGTFAYMPAAGTVLNAGANQALSAAFTPTDATNYATASVATTITVNQAAATITLGNLTPTYDGTPKAATATTTPAGLSVKFSYNGNSTPPTAAGSYTVIATINNANYTGSATGTLIIGKSAATTLALGQLQQAYDGTAKSVTVVTTPAGLTVNVTYDGAAAAPIYPGPHAVVATINDPNYTGSVSGTLTITVTALVRHAPTLNGIVDGSVQVLSAESFTLNSNSSLSGDLLVPGTPTVQLNGHPTYVGTKDGPGSATPANYSVTLNSNAVLRYLVRRINAIALPTVSAPPAPTGTRSVTLNKSTDPIGVFATLRDLTLNGNVGSIAVPAGNYGSFTANGGGGFILGVAGATTPAVYNLQNLTLNGNATLQFAGPVTLTLANGLTLNGAVGDLAHPEQLTLSVYAGGVTLNGGASLSGTVVAPNGTVIVNGNSTLHGTVSADRLTLNGNALLEDPTP